MGSLCRLTRSKPAIGGGGTYCNIGARLWLSPEDVGMVVDRGPDFPAWIQRSLDSYGKDMWFLRDQANAETTKAVNIYRGDTRGFAYLTPRIRITPRDLLDTPLSRPRCLHFISSPQRAKVILDEVGEIPDWDPICIYEPIPDRCVPEELPALKEIITRIHVLSPNAEEALSLLSMPKQPTPELIEQAAASLRNLGASAVVIRSGALGAYLISESSPETWIPAFFGEGDAARIVDVTGAGNAFLGGFAAGYSSSDGDLRTACLYGTVSASYVIEQKGLPTLTHNAAGTEVWNGSDPKERLDQLKKRVGTT